MRTFESLGQFSGGVLFLKAILEEATVIPRKINGFWLVPMSRHAYAGFVKLEAPLFNVQNLKNRPTTVIDRTGDSIRHYGLTKPNCEENKTCAKSRPSPLAKG